MSSAVSLLTLRTRARRLADIEGATARFPDAELNDYANRSIAECYDVIRSAFGDDFFRSQYTFQTINGTSLYSLPADFLSLISVDAYLTATSIVSCKKYTEDQRNLFKWYPVGWIFGQPIFYRLQAANISFIPTPTGIFGVTLNYVPTPAVLTQDADAFDSVNGWDEYVTANMAIMCAAKDENYDLINNVLAGLKAAAKSRIQALATERDGGQPERVHDIYLADEWWMG